MDHRLILPGTLEFYLASQDLPPPPGWKDNLARSEEIAYIAPLGQSGLLEAVPISRAWEYAYDGEMDERQAEIEEYEPEFDLWLPGDPLAA